MRMVIRSTLGELPNAYVQLGRITALEGHTDAGLEYLDTNDRHVAPPLGSQQLAEWHAKFDAAIGDSTGSANLNAQFDIAKRESGSFLQAGPNVFVVNPAHPDQATVLTPAWKKEDTLQSGEYVCHDIDQLDLPYLPDPMSVGASFTSLPGAPGTWLQQWEPTAANAPWYDRRPLRVRIENGAGPPVYDANAPPAHRAAPAGRDGDRQPVVVPHRRHPGAVRSVDDPAQHLPSVAPTPNRSQGGTGVDAHAVERAHAGAHGREAARATGDRGAGSRRAEHRGAALRRRDVRGARRGSCRTTPRAPADSTWRRRGPNRSTTCSSPRRQPSRVPHTSATSNSRRPRTRVGSTVTTRPPRERSRRGTSSVTNSRTPSTATSPIRRPRRPASASTSRR